MEVLRTLGYLDQEIELWFTNYETLIPNLYWK